MVKFCQQFSFNRSKCGSEKGLKLLHLLLQIFNIMTGQILLFLLLCLAITFASRNILDIVEFDSSYVFFTMIKYQPRLRFSWRCN